MKCHDEVALRVIGVLAGLPYEEAREILDVFDWSGYWPVVNGNGLLTGAISEGLEMGTDCLVVVDCGPDGIVRAGDTCTDALCLEKDLPRGEKNV